jgi:HAD superfamily hydrolase (TIGR01509 family)
MIRHVIFDCDGVLLDSEEISMRVDQMLLASAGVGMSEAELHRRFVGKTFQDMIDEVEAETGLSLPKDLEARKDGLMLDLYRRDLKAIAGVGEALAVLTQSWPVSIGTNGPRARALEALRIVGIDHYFGDRMTTFEDVANGKPAPDIYLLAAQRAGRKPEECVVVEDSVTGVMAAVAAGCVTFGFTGAHLHRDEHALKLAELGAAKVFHHMRELPDLIASFA